MWKRFGASVTALKRSESAAKRRFLKTEAARDEHIIDTGKKFMIRRKRLFWQLFPSYAGIIVIALTAVSLFSLSYMKTFYHQQTLRDLESLARVMRLRVAPLMEEARFDQVDAYCKGSAESAGSRVTVIDRDGRVLGDSTKDPRSMENHGIRPEVVAALGGETGSSIRFSSTLATNML
jgi:two-component system phosphate regulon sensor histidine kinase PhoR